MLLLRPALLSDPGRTSTPDHFDVSVLPRYSYNEGSPINKHFEAQSHGLTTCCLRLKTPFLVANQGSLPVGGQPFPGGLVPAGFQ